MPTTRRRVGRGFKGRLTPDQIQHFFHGWTLDDCFHPFYHLHGDSQFPFENQEHRRRLWFENREWLLSLAGQTVPGVFAGLGAGEKPKALFEYEEGEVA